MVARQRNRHPELGPMDSASNGGLAQAARRSRRRGELAADPGHAHHPAGRLRPARPPHRELALRGSIRLAVVPRWGWASMSYLGSEFSAALMRLAASSAMGL